MSNSTTDVTAEISQKKLASAVNYSDTLANEDNSFCNHIS